MSAVVSTGSLEYVRVPVSATEAGQLVDPTGLTVRLGFVRPGVTPQLGELVLGSWEADTTTRPTTYRARALVGPGGGTVLAPGRYVVWVHVTDSPEVPLRPAGELRVI